MNCLFDTQTLSRSKHIMNKVMFLAEALSIQIYYKDTDSMHIPRNDVETLATAFKTKYNGN